LSEEINIYKSKKANEMPILFSPAGGALGNLLSLSDVSPIKTKAPGKKDISLDLLT
jgi:hypothetical protein